jgi:hypothetical protein
MVQEIVGAERAQPFEPHRPLVRMALWSESAGGRHLFTVTVPHMVFDGWSKSILLADLIAFYADGAGAVRPPVHGWWDYREDQLARVDAGLDAFTYWHRHLRDARPLLDLDDSTRAAVQRGLPTATLTAELGPAYERRRRASAAAGVTPELATLTAVIRALSVVFDSDDVLVGLPAANRDDARWAQTVALVSLYLPIRHRAGRGTADASSVRQVLRDALAHRLPFETVKAVTDSGVPTDCAVTVATPAPPFALPGMTATPIVTPTTTAHRPIDVILDITGERARLAVGHLVDLVPAAGARRVLDLVAEELT